MDEHFNKASFENLVKRDENIDKVQKVFNHRAMMNGLSSKAEWLEKLENSRAA